MFKKIIKIGLLLGIVFWAGFARAETHRVVNGDTLGKIAAKYGVSVSRLKSWNGLKNDRIYVGQRLKINQTDSGRTETYRVKSGDTLGKIAAKHKVSVNRLKTLNGLKNDRIYVGQRLKIRPTSTAESKNYTIRRDYYTVKKGDNLSRIAARTHTTVNNLIKLNRLKSTVVRPGQRLLIRTRRVAKKPRAATYPDTPPVIEPTAIIDESELIFYTVKEGETLETIARQYGLTPEDIREANLMPEESEVKKGQILSIPQEDATE